MQKVKKRYLPSSSLGIWLKGKYPLGVFEGICLFTNRVITHFGSNFLTEFRVISQIWE